jgi:hypothetical protein
MKNISSTKLLKRGDIIVCITKDWQTYTYGNKYEVLMDQFGPDRMSIVDVMNDRGQRYMPASNYLVTLEEWRVMKIDEIIKPVD